MTTVMTGAFANWGPAFLICLTVVIGIFYNNARLGDFSRRLDDAGKRGDDIRSYIDARFNGIDRRFDDLKDFIKSEVRRLEERQSPIHSA